VIGPGSATVTFYVVRIDFQGGNDTVTVYQNPTSLTEPATPTLTFPGAGDLSFNGISVGCFNNGRTVMHDEVRIGETWADVVNPGTYSAGNWDGGGTDSKWSTGANWDNNAVPVFPSSLVFAGATRLNNTNDLADVSVNDIVFDAGAGAFILNGNSLGVNGTIRFNGNPSSPVTQTIRMPLVPAGSFAAELRTNGNVTISGDITAPASEFTQNGVGNSGVLTLAGTNSLKGMVINNGTNRITGTTEINGIGGSSFFFLADANTARQATLIIEEGGSLSVRGAFQDAGVIGRDGGVATVIQNGGIFSFDINDGSHESLFIGASGNPNTRATYEMRGGVLDMNGRTLGLGLGANTLITGMVNQVSGVVTNVQQLYFSPFFAQGRGIYNLTGGSLWIGAGGITVFQGGGYELNLGGGTMGAQTPWTSALDMNLTGINGPVTFNTAGNVISLSGILSGSGGLIVSGGGSLVLSGANTYTGDTTVTAGSTLQKDAPGSGAGALRLANGATLNLNFSGVYAVGSLYTNGVALPVGTYNAGSLAGFISGSGELQVTSGISTGLWTGLGPNNNWSTGGNWDNNAVPIFPHAVTFAGSTRLNNNNDLSAITLSSLTFDAAAGPFVLGGNDVTLTGGIAINGTPATPVTHTINFGMTVTGDQTINLPANGNLVLGGSIMSGFNLAKSGAGTLTLSGPNDLFSSLVVNGGTNVISGGVTISGTGGGRFYIGDIGNEGTLVIQPGAVLDVNGNFADAAVLGRDSGRGTVIQNGGTFNFNMGNQNYFFVGASGNAATRAEYHMNGGIFDLNNHVLGIALSANSSTLITGVVHQAGGVINNVSRLNLGIFTLGPGRGIYRMTGGSMYIGADGIVSESGVYEVYLGGGTIGALSSWASSLNMTLTGSNGPVTFDTAGNVITLTGILSGPGGLAVSGGGILALGGANTFAGDLTVNAGTLELDVTGSSAGSLRLAIGTMLNLNFSGNYIAGGFFTNGVALANGTYNSANLPGFLMGSGNLVVQGVSTGTWDGGGTDSLWSTANNWDHNALPVFPIGLTFAGNARLNNTNDLAGATATSLTFGAAAGAFSLNGTALNVNGNIAFSGNPSSPVTQTINLPLMLGASVVMDTPSNGSLLVNGDMTSSSTLYKLGNGNLNLTGNNALAAFEADGGTTVISGNTVVTGTGGSRAYVANANYVGGAVASLVISSGGTFTLNGSFADAFVIGRDGGKGTVIQTGGTFNFAPDNSSAIFVGAGNNPSSTGTYEMNGGLFDLNGSTLGIGLGAQGASVTGLVSQASGIITNVGRLTLGWNNNQNGRGIYRMTGGSIYIGAQGIDSQTGIYEMYLGGGTIGALADWSSALNMSLTGVNGPVMFNPAGALIALAGVISGPGGLTVAGGGTLALSGANTYTGDTTVTGGSTLRLNASGSSPSTFRLAAGAMLDLNYTGNFAVAGLQTNGVALPSGTYTAANLPGYISGAGSIQVLNAIPTTPINVEAAFANGKLNLSWPSNYRGWVLQTQTNSLSVGLGQNWFDVPGSSTETSTSITVDPAAPAVFYRLRYPTP
jgi:autotransporter-associated beta strand protein